MFTAKPDFYIHLIINYNVRGTEINIKVDFRRVLGKKEKAKTKGKEKEKRLSLYLDECYVE